MELTFRPDGTTDEQDALSSLYAFLRDDEQLDDIADLGLHPATVPEDALGVDMVHDAVTVVLHIWHSLGEAKPDVDAAGVVAAAGSLVSAAVNWIKSRSRGERVVLRNSRGDEVVIRTKDPATLAAVAGIIAAVDEPDKPDKPDELGAAGPAETPPGPDPSGTEPEGAV